MGDLVDWVNFGRQIAAARALLGISRDALAKATNVAPATISRLENGAGDIGTTAGILVQGFLERSGIEFIEGTLGVAVALREKPGTIGSSVAIAGDPSMPNGTRFLWSR